jgi:S-adenosylmethionine hydrolase
MPRPVVALLTDFGTRDHYVGALKGAVLAACPEATLVDLLHDVPAHDVAHAAFELARTYRVFPAGTVFVVVVDPEVGSRRRGLAAEAGGYRFVAPDNGLLTRVLAENHASRTHEITNRGLFRYEVSPTFHARDIFGPVAGHLAQGAPLELVGPPLDDPVLLLLDAVQQRKTGEWHASVQHVDRFGNLTTQIGKRDLDAILTTVDGYGAGIVVVIEGQVLPFVTTYADVPEGEACALIGGSGYLEVAVRSGSAARLLGAGKGVPVTVRAVSATGG